MQVHSNRFLEEVISQIGNFQFKQEYLNQAKFSKRIPNKSKWILRLKTDNLEICNSQQNENILTILCPMTSSNLMVNC